jgi:hypothetical protein
LRANSFYAIAQPRATITGEVTLDGKPVSWGSISFYPDDKNLPVTTVRIRNGKFSAKRDDGPMIGSSKVIFEGSIWEATGLDKDRSVRLESLKPNDSTKTNVKIEKETKPIRLEYFSR